MGATNHVKLGVPNQDASQGPKHSHWAKYGGYHPNIKLNAEHYEESKYAYRNLHPKVES